MPTPQFDAQATGFLEATRRAGASGLGTMFHCEDFATLEHATAQLLYVGQPPLREQRDVDALWAGLRQGVINTVCTDHAPWSLEAGLDPSLSITNLRPGVENLQMLLPMLYSEGVRRGRISLSRLIEVTSTNAARLFGLYQHKGTLAVGSDADITVLDPDHRTVDAEVECR